MAKDPICGMEVNIHKAKYKALGKYLCSETCQKKYKGRFIEIGLSLLLIAIATIVYVKGYMLPFMGVAFLILSGLKLIDVKGFSKMFQQYDLLANKFNLYGLIYPFIELSLASMFLFNYQIKLAAVITILIMGVGSVGVGKNIFSKNKVQCACLGAKIKVPLTRFTLVEDLVMLVMGIMILI